MKNIHNISAGAGSGKTTRLVGIITDLVSGKMGEKCSPERMILTTFTKAAATEFKERAAAKLIEGGFLEEAVTLDAAMIGTVHSIAQTYITRYWYLCGMSPNITPVTDVESRKMLNESLAEFVTAQDMAFFHNYVRTFGITKSGDGYGYHDDFWKEQLMKISESLMFEPDKEACLKNLRDKSVSLLSSMFDAARNEELIEKAQKCAKDYLVYCEDDTMYDNRSAGKAQKHASVANSILKGGLYENSQLKDMCKNLDKTPFGLKRDMKDAYEATVAEAHKALLDAVERIIPKEASWISECSGRICDIALRWMDGYKKLKRASGVIDFSDMEVLFLELLSKEEVLEDIRSSIDYLFVDEFQDCNPVQIRIFDILSENVKQSWFVGDPKQAIYGFRGSNVELVNEFSSKFPKNEKDKTSFTGFKKNEDGLSSEILDKSYRSHASLVDLSNKVFKEAFSADLAEENIVLKQGRETYQTEQPVIHHIHVDGAKKEEKCAALASGITRLLNGEYPNLTGFTFSPSDIAVLVRNNANAGEVAAALKKNGVPVSFVDTAFADSAEVSLLLTLLRFATRRQDKKSVAELTSLIDGLGLREVLVKAISTDESENFWGGLRNFLKSTSTLSVVDLVDAVIARFDLYNFVSCWGDVDNRRSNIDLVRQIARQFDTMASTFAKASDLSSFLGYIESYKPEAKFNNQDAGVKVLTYHKSKGLEWKVVFLADIDGDLSDDVSLRSLVGLHGDVLVPDLSRHEPVWLTDAVIADKQMQELFESVSLKELGEERRLLYVGLTRARDFVFTVGSVGVGMKKLQQCCPTAAGIDYSIVGDDEFDIWGVGMKSCCYQCTPDTVRYNFADSKPARIRDAGFALPETALLSYAEKYHNPSKYKEQELISATSPEVVKEYVRIDISHNAVEDNEFGDCIHHIYALGSHPDKAKRLAAAERTLNAYGLDAGKADAILERFDDLCGYLRKEYGDPERGVEHELPFIYKDAEGRVFSGTMDMVWKTKDCCVVVDYKTFSGTREAAMKKSAEEYGPQMAIYRSAMEAAGEKVPAVLILYPVIGLIVKVN